MKTALVFGGWLLGFAGLCGAAWLIAAVFTKLAKWLVKKGVREGVAWGLPFIAFLCVVMAAVFTWAVPRLATAKP